MTTFSMGFLLFRVSRASPHLLLPQGVKEIRSDLLPVSTFEDSVREWRDPNGNLLVSKPNADMGDNNERRIPVLTLP
jgi:hypothetical protein